MRQRIDRLINLLYEGVYEKDTELRLSMLAALAGQSILLLGPPGVAKSMIAHRLKNAFRDARAFEYLMSKFSTPDEIFGPVSIARLKNSDKYERTSMDFLQQRGKAPIAPKKDKKQEKNESSPSFFSSYAERLRRHALPLRRQTTGSGTPDHRFYH